MIYSYIAKKKDGEILRLVIEAPSRMEALHQLEGENLRVIELNDKVTEQTQRAVKVARKGKSKAKAEKKARPFSGLQGKVKSGDVAVFCRQLAISSDAGLPLRDALHSIGLELDHPVLRKNVADIVNRIGAGQRFSEAISAHPKVFNAMFCGLSEAAEESGKMTAVLMQISDYMEKTDKLTRRIQAMLAYPAFIGGFFVFVSLVMTFYILPKFSTVFEGLGGTLPTLTQIVFDMNTFILGNFTYIATGIAAVGLAVYLFGKTSSGKYFWDAFKMNAPLLGEITKKYLMARFCRGLSIMVESGVPIERALSIGARASGNVVVEKKLEEVRNRIILQGHGISESLKESGFFPSLVVQMVSVGEEAGRLSDVLEKVAELYEDQVEVSIMSIMGLFEPLIIGIFGGLILIMVLAIYMPIFTLSSNV